MHLWSQEIGMKEMDAASQKQPASRLSPQNSDFLDPDATAGMLVWALMSASTPGQGLQEL